jgi:ankyrin repeat protein
MNKKEANQKMIKIMNKKTLLSKEEIQLFKELIYQCDLTQQNQNNWTPLIFSLFYNQEQNLHLTQEQFNYLIQNSNLKQQDNDDWTPLMFALFYNQEQNLQLTKHQFQTMYDVLNEEQQQSTFQKFIDEKNYNNQQYLEEINLLLYDYQFQPNEQTIDWLQENKYQDILQMIEKRNLFFKLYQNIKQMDNHQKINSMKI